MDASDINLLDRDVFARGVPDEWFTWLRANAPIHKHPEQDGPGFWVITKHADVNAISRDATTFSSRADLGGAVNLEDSEFTNIDLGDAGKLLLVMDPPGHTQHRKLISAGFTPRMVSRMEPQIRQTATRFIDKVVEMDSCDFVTDVAVELPLHLMSDLLGIPDDDRHQLFEWSNQLVASDDPEYQVTSEVELTAQLNMFVYAQKMAELRRAAPADDLVTSLLQAEVDGEQLSDLDFNLFFLLMVVAGSETTRNGISHGLLALVEHPDQFELLRSDLAAYSLGATNEILRWASPVLFSRRNVTHDVEYRGFDMKKGDKVSIWYASANRDEAVFDDPFTFDITRDPNPHVSFNGGGPHYCLGAQLALLEMRVFFEELLTRVGKVQLLGEPERLRSNFLRGIKHLPVSLHQ